MNLVRINIFWFRREDGLAIYHLRLKLVKRKATLSSVVAASAYRSGQPLYDDSQCRWYRYNKPDVVHTAILAPDNAAEWIFDRQRFWNIVQRAEVRVDAQLAREIELTLPYELDRAAQIELVHRYVRDMFISRGMAADIAIHEPMGANGKKQPHAHVLLTLRELDPTSSTGFSANKNRDWNEPEDIREAVARARKRFNNTGLDEDKAALKEVQAKRNVNVWRKAWADYGNQALADAGSAARIDHRTLKEQGIDRPPQPFFGLARHIERAYDYLKDRLTQWVAVKKRAELYADLEHYKRTDPVKLAEFVLRLGDMAEEIAGRFRRPPPDREVSHER